MSGGVDSTSCVLLLQKEYDVSGFFMELAQPDIDQQKQNVRHMADRLGIELTVIDLRRKFKEKVLDYFTSSYFSGRTPNPCMICNREIKFGLFMGEIIASGMDMVATGHYARVVRQDGLSHLYRGIDSKKDQSYFLARLSQQQLSRVIFPLGEQEKEATYQFIEKNGFDQFRGMESQDVCFYKNGTVGDYLQTNSHAKLLPGKITTDDGRIIGSHNGLFRYTIGQRRGLGISDATPWYVIGLDGEKNQVIVGKQEDLLQDTINIKNLNWVSGKEPDFSLNYQVQIRYSHKGSPAKLIQIGKKRYSIQFEKQQRAVTPGQFTVIYYNDEVIGSGEII